MFKKGQKVKVVAPSSIGSTKLLGCVGTFVRYNQLTKGLAYITINNREHCVESLRLAMYGNILNV